jgi:hypothetical protein
MLMNLNADKTLNTRLGNGIAPAYHVVQIAVADPMIHSHRGHYWVAMQQSRLLQSETFS